MNNSRRMSPEYLALAAERAATKCAPHFQPEMFNYDFRSWVSPYTKTANRSGGFAFVLQDWASEDGLRYFNQDIQDHGRTPGLLTNRRLEALLSQVFGIALAEVYVTNAFPFVKKVGMSGALSAGDVRKAARAFLARELQIIKPTRVFALGAVAQAALDTCKVPYIRLPHPAARIGGLRKHEDTWRLALATSDIPTIPATYVER